MIMRNIVINPTSFLVYLFTKIIILIFVIIGTIKRVLCKSSLFDILLNYLQNYNSYPRRLVTTVVYLLSCIVANNGERKIWWILFGCTNLLI